MQYKIFPSHEKVQPFLRDLKLTACPHRNATGTLNRHGFLKGFQGNELQQKSTRAHRVFCSNRGNRPGCGRTFSLWIAERIKRLSLSATPLWKFLWQSASTGNKRPTFASLDCDLSSSAPYRIFKRFQNKQAFIRTALAFLCTPPEFKRGQPGGADDLDEPTGSTLEHLCEVFGEHQAEAEVNDNLPLVREAQKEADHETAIGLSQDASPRRD